MPIAQTPRLDFQNVADIGHSYFLSLFACSFNPLELHKLKSVMDNIATLNIIVIQGHIQNPVKHLR